MSSPRSNNDTEVGHPSEESKHTQGKAPPPLPLPSFPSAAPAPPTPTHTAEEQHSRTAGSSGPTIDTAPATKAPSTIQNTHTTANALQPEEDTNPLAHGVPSSHAAGDTRPASPPPILRNNYTRQNNNNTTTNNNNKNHTMAGPMLYVNSPEPSGNFAFTSTNGSASADGGSSAGVRRRNPLQSNTNTINPANSGAYYTSDEQNDEFNQTYRKHYINEEEEEDDEAAAEEEEEDHNNMIASARENGAEPISAATASGATGNEVDNKGSEKRRHKKDIPLYERYKPREIIIGHALFIPMSLVAFVFIVVSIGIPWFKKMQFNNTNDDLDVVKNFYPFKITGHFTRISTGEAAAPSTHFTSGDLCLPVKRRMKVLEGFLISAAVFCFVTFILSIVNCVLGGGKRLYAKTNQMGNINNLLFAKKHHGGKARHNERRKVDDGAPLNRHARPIYLAMVYFSIFSFGAITCAISFAWNMYLTSFRNPYCGIDNVDVRIFPGLVLASGPPKQWRPSPDNMFGPLAILLTYQGPRPINSYHSQYYEPSYGIGLAMTAWVLIGLGGLFAAFHLTAFADPPRRVERTAETYAVCVLLVLLFATISSPMPQFFYKNENTSSVTDVYLWRYQNHTVSWSRIVTPDPIAYNTSVFLRDLTCHSIQRYFRAAASFSIISIGFAFFNALYSLSLLKFFATSRVPAIVLSCLTAVFLLINFALTLKIYYGHFCGGEFAFHKKRFVLSVGFACNVTAFCLSASGAVFSGLSHHLSRRYFPAEEEQKRRQQQAREEADKKQQMRCVAAAPPAAAAAAAAPVAAKECEKAEDKAAAADAAHHPPTTTNTGSSSSGGGAAAEGAETAHRNQHNERSKSSSNSQQQKEGKEKKE